jgi:hypothetical protein
MDTPAQEHRERLEQLIAPVLLHTADISATACSSLGNGKQHNTEAPHYATNLPHPEGERKAATAGGMIGEGPHRLKLTDVLIVGCSGCNRSPSLYRNHRILQQVQGSVMAG